MASGKYFGMTIFVASMLSGFNYYDAYGQSADIRGNTAEELLDRSSNPTGSEDFEQSQQKKDKINPDEVEKSLSSGSAILNNMPSDKNLVRLAEKIRTEPNNLDHYFAYAQMATQLGNHQAAAETYERMLRLAPTLDRIRLDLAVSYTYLAQFAKAKEQMERVLERQPPEQVRKNIEAALLKLDNELKVHDVSASVSVGLNHDSNANSAPASGSILIFDTVIPLNGDQLRQSDLQAFGSAQLDHRFKPSWGKWEESSLTWNSTISAYRAEQWDLDNLNLAVFSAKVGPELTLKKSGLKLSPSLGYSTVFLDDKEYLKTISAGLDSEIPISQQLLLRNQLKHEWRDFQNAPDVTTYADRTGSASSANFGITFLASPQDIFMADATTRKERTREIYLDNFSVGISAGYTRLLPYDAFANIRTSFTSSIYDGADALISSKTRHDKEYSAGLTAGKKITDSITASLGYEYRDVNSNILNYTYEDHRVSATLNWRY